MLAQISSHEERASKNERAVRVVQSYSHAIRRDVNQIFKDGYWVVVCD